MQKNKKRWKTVSVGALLLLALLLSACPKAEAAQGGGAAEARPARESAAGGDGAVEEAAQAVLDAEEISSRFLEYLEENDLNPELISVGYVYPETGERWYHNEDSWYYSASLYKVPLMMLYAEQVAGGELTQDSDVFGMPLSRLEELVLIESNNDLAYAAMLRLGQPDACRRMFQQYSDLAEEDYPWEFAGSSYFSARFMTDVMATLFSEPDRFPYVAECLKQAQPEHYFRLSLEEAEVEIAQKYGSYQDWDGRDWNHTAGIVYTRHPFILVVMTRYGGVSETLISGLASLFYEYTLSLDQGAAVKD